MKIIAVDAMGGDHAPQEIINGVLIAAKNHNISIKLIGDKTIIEPLLPKQKNIEIVHAKESIEMDESPMVAYKQKKDSSIHVGLNLVKEV